MHRTALGADIGARVYAACANANIHIGMGRAAFFAPGQNGSCGQQDQKHTHIKPSFSVGLKGMPQHPKMRQG